MITNLLKHRWLEVVARNLCASSDCAASAPMPSLAHIFKGDFETAIDWTDKACEIPNCQFWAHAHRAVAFAHLGETTRAKQELELVLRERPNFSGNFAREKLFFIKNPEQLEIYLEGLRQAGASETL